MATYQVLYIGPMGGIQSTRQEVAERASDITSKLNGNIPAGCYVAVSRIDDLPECRTMRSNGTRKFKSMKSEAS